MRNILSRTLIGAAAMTLAVLVFPKGADALTVSPPYVDHALNPGDTVLETIKLYNEEEWPITIYPIAVNFEAGQDEAGQPVFYPGDEDRLGRGLAKWLSFDGSPLVINGKERANVAVAINVPRDAQPGGHFGAIMLSTSPPDVQSGIGLSQQIAALIMIRVSGDVVEQGSLAEFGFKNPKVWYNYLPIDLFLRFENDGNVHLRPTGNIFINDWTGRQVASLVVNEEFRSVLPMSIRRFENSWTKNVFRNDVGELEKEWKNFAVGKHTATLVINYGAQNKLLMGELTFYVWPWRLMIIGGVILLTSIVLLVVLKKLNDAAVIRRYKKMVAKKEAGEKK